MAHRSRSVIDGLLEYIGSLAHMSIMSSSRDIMPQTKLFNPLGDDRNREIWFGNPTNLIELNNIKYPWAMQLYNQMRENFWIPQKIDLVDDARDYFSLTTEEQRAYRGILSYLTFLDSLQTCNIPYLKISVTAPEVGLCMAEQISQEALHNQSYQYLIDTVIPPDLRSDIYEHWRSDPGLLYRCEWIAKYYQDYQDNPTAANYFIALIADYILEGLYFYNGFQFYYTLASRNLMLGTADMFKMINRDELSHVRLYQKLIPEAIQVFGSSPSDIYSMFDRAAKNEIAWTNHIIGDSILGITSHSTAQYTKWLTNTRLRAIGLEPLYDNVSNPYQHLLRLSDTQGSATSKANFFEATVTSYVMSSGVGGWDEL